MNKQRAYVLIGLPGAGKSTWTEKQMDELNPRGIGVVSRDAIRYMINGNYKYIEEQQSLITKIAKESAMAILHNGHDLVIDQANISRDIRDEVIVFLRGLYGLDIEIHFVYMMESDTETLIDRRMVGDSRGYGTSYYRTVIEKMKRNFEPPSSDEDYDVVLYVNANGEVVDKGVKHKGEKKADVNAEIPIKELWNLHYTLAEYIYPRLKAFRETHGGAPGSFGNDKNGNPMFSMRYGPDTRKKLCFQMWDEILDKMILAFELWLSQDDWDCEFNSKEHNKRLAKIEEGFSLFAKYFNSLWW